MSRGPVSFAALAFCVIAASSFSILPPKPCAAQEEQVGEHVLLTGQVELKELVDLCAAKLNLNIEYDTTILQGSVTLRLENSLTDKELWALTNRVLAARQLTTVRLPGADSDDTLAVVRISDAAPLSTLVEVDEPGFQKREAGEETRVSPGYMTVVTRIEHQQVDHVIQSLEAVLSPQGSQAVAVGTGGLLVISDLRPRIDEALRLIELIDAPGADAIVRRYEPKHLAASQLATTLTTVLNSKSAVEGQVYQSKVIADPFGQGLLMIARISELEAIESLIAQFDDEPLAETRTYTPRNFAAAEVADLIQRVMQPQTTTTGTWRIVENEFSGSLIVTATPKQHARIEELIRELDALPVEARRPIRPFTLRNRDVEEILMILQNLLAEGAFAEDAEAFGLGESGTVVRDSLREGGEKPIERSPAAESGNQTSKMEPNPQSDERIESTPAQAPRMRRRGAEGPDLPDVTLTADKGTNTLIAIGEPRLLAQIEDVIARLDVRQPQVMLEVLIVNLTESQTRDLGIELEKLEVRGSTRITLSSLFGLSEPGDGVGERTLTNSRGGSVLVLSPGDFSVIVRALETLNEGQTLNIPKVLVGNNQQATLDSVLRQPFASVNASDTVATTSFGGTEDAGTQVTVTPHIAEGDHLVLEYSVSLSSFVGDSSDPALPPPRQENRLESVATVPDGFIAALGGLESHTDGSAVSQVPFAGRLPIIGNLFKNRSKSSSRSRFFVFLRPVILRDPSFEDLRYVSRQNAHENQVDDGWPVVEPLLIR